MTDLSFTPTFHHIEWIDNLDRVTAGGPNGCNVRLNAITADLQQISAVVGQIDTAIDQRRVGAPPKEHRVTVPLELFTVDSGGVAPALGWFYDDNGAVHPQNGHRGAGTLTVLVLPDNATLVSFRLRGRYPGGGAGFVYALTRVSLTDPTQRKQLGSVDNTVAGLTDPYDLTVTISDQQLALVDNGAFRYLMELRANLFDQPVDHTVDSLQLVYTTQ
jgi:hypothetical protein